MEKTAEALLNYGALGIITAVLLFALYKLGKVGLTTFFTKLEENEKLKEAALTKALDENAKRFETITGTLKSMHEETQRRDHQTELEKREWAGKVFTQIERIAAELSDFAATVRNHDVEIRLLKEGLERHAHEIEKIIKHINI